MAEKTIQSNAPTQERITSQHQKADSPNAGQSTWIEKASGAALINSRRTVVYPPLDQETRTHLPTAQAGFYLGRAGQTLRLWACLEDGPIRPIRVHGRLMWPTEGIRRLLGVTR